MDFKEGENIEEYSVKIKRPKAPEIPKEIKEQMKRDDKEDYDKYIENICISCGNSIKRNAKFCPTCGVKVKKKEQKKYCDKCGEEVRRDQKFCGRCGQRLG